MRYLFKYFKGYKLEAVLAPLFKMLEAIMELLVPIVVASVINNGIIKHDTQVIIVDFCILIGLAIAGLLFSFTAQWFSAKASVGCATRLRKSLFDHILGLSYNEIDKLGGDTLITRITSDVNQVQNGINMTLRLLLRSPFVVFGSMIMAFTIDVRSAVIFAAVIPLLVVVVGGIMKITIPMYHRSQEHLDGVLSSTREQLTGVRVIRAFHNEDREVEDFKQKNNLLTRINERVGRISALMNPMSFVIINIAAIILIYVGALRVESGSLRQGDVVALYNYMAQIVIELIKFASLIVTINRSMACAKRIGKVFEEKSSVEYPEDGAVSGGSSDYIAFENVSFSYIGQKEHAISDITFAAKKGETIGIIGGTGSGKSTLVNLIPRFYDAAEGRILVDGIDVKEYKKGGLTDMVGIVPQKTVLFEGTIRDNLKLGNESATDEELWDAIKIAQAEDVVTEKSGGLDYHIEQKGRNLSGGQKQRLTIARALVKKPEILILDDSSSALDMITDLALRTAIKSKCADTTVIIVSQRTSSIRSADRILVMDDGMIVGHGTHDELLADCEIYQEIYYSQFPEEKDSNSAKSETPTTEIGVSGSIAVDEVPV